jgi:hypothetical protein
MGKTKKTNFLIIYMMLAAFISFSGCISFEKFYHNNLYYGEIMEIKNNEITFYTGNQNKFKIGQELKAYMKVIEKINLGSVGSRHSIQNNSRIEINETALVKITGFVSDKYARAVVIKGSLSKGDVIELDSLSHH